MLLVYFLICVFTLLLGIHLFSTSTLMEGLETQTQSQSSKSSPKTYQPYNLNEPNNSVILSQQNAGNIEVLKGRIDELDGVKQSVNSMQQNINSMQIQIDGLVKQQSTFATELTGNTPAQISGTEMLKAKDVEDENKTLK